MADTTVENEEFQIGTPEERAQIARAHQLLTDFVNGLPPTDAEALWLYFDGCNMLDIIEVAAERALTDPEIRKRQIGDKGSV